MNACPTRRQTLLGILYTLFQFAVLPSLLFAIRDRLPFPLSESQLNLIFFAINFLAVTGIFHSYLKDSLAPVRESPSRFFTTVLLGWLLCSLAQSAVSVITLLILPDFLNQNDLALGQMAGSEFLITAIGTVILVPPAEECIHRGMIFRGLYGKNKAAAYLVSAALFSSIHVIGYLGLYSGPQLIAAFLQYLLPGLILAWSYRRGGTIYVSIVIHALINLKGMILLLVR